MSKTIARRKHLDLKARLCAKRLLYHFNGMKPNESSESRKAFAIVSCLLRGAADARDAIVGL